MSATGPILRRGVRRRNEIGTAFFVKVRATMRNCAAGIFVGDRRNNGPVRMRGPRSMAPSGDQILEPGATAHELAAACQRFVGGVLIVEPGAFITAVGRLAAEQPVGHTDAESVLI